MSEISKAQVIKINDLPLEQGETLDGKNILDEEEYSVKWMVKKRPFNDRYSDAVTCNIIYFILNDGGYALVNGEKTLINRGDSVYVPKGSSYYLSSGTECVAFCQPRFTRS